MKVHRPSPFKNHEVITHLKIIGKAAVIVLFFITIYVSFILWFSRNYEVSNFAFAIGLILSIFVAYIFNLKFIFKK